MRESTRRFFGIVALALLVVLGMLFWFGRKRVQTQEIHLKEIAKLYEEYEEEMVSLRAEIRQLREEAEREKAEAKLAAEEEAAATLAVQSEQGRVILGFGVATQWEVNHVSDKEGILVVSAIQNKAMLKSLENSGKELVLHVTPFDEKKLSEMKEKLNASAVLLSAEDNTPENRAIVEKLGFSVCICEGEQAAALLSDDLVGLSAVFYSDKKSNIAETLTQIEEEKLTTLVVLQGDALSVTPVEESMKQIAAAEENGSLVSGSLADAVAQIRASAEKVESDKEGKENTSPNVSQIEQEIREKEARLEELEAKMTALYESWNTEA